MASPPLVIGTRSPTEGGSQAVDAATPVSGVQGLPAVLVSYRRAVVVALHDLLVPLIYFLAFALKFDFDISEQYLDVFLNTVLLLVPIRLALFWGYRLYHGWWRHVGMYDLIALVRATTVSSFLFLAALFLTGQHTGFPRSIPFIDWT